ncbi:MAG: hypothetical protein RR768_03270 [Clostridium sp.]
MKNYIVFMKEKKGKLCVLIICLLLLSVSGTLLLPHLMIQWSHDRPFGILHTLVGVFAGMTGIIGIILLFRNTAIRRNKKWKKEFLAVFITYFILQLVSGVLLGVLGVGLHYTVRISYDMTKQTLYIVTEILQNIIRIMTLFFLVERLNQKCWKDDKIILIKAGFAALILSTINVLILCIPLDTLMVALQGVWQIIYILIFLVYFMEKSNGGAKK